jgi:hypothetical protein
VSRRVKSAVTDDANVALTALDEPVGNLSIVAKFRYREKVTAAVEKVLRRWRKKQTSIALLKQEGGGLPGAGGRGCY